MMKRSPAAMCAEAVADKLGLEIVFQETQWDAIFAGLDAGRFDVIANQVSINPEREEKYLFSEPYTVSPGVIVVAEDDVVVGAAGDRAVVPAEVAAVPGEAPRTCG